MVFCITGEVTYSSPLAQSDIVARLHASQAGTSTTLLLHGHVRFLMRACESSHVSTSMALLPQMKWQLRHGGLQYCEELSSQ